MDRLDYIIARLQWLHERKLVQRDWREELILKMEIIDLLKERRTLLSNIK
jgi:hypothetical protein